MRLTLALAVLPAFPASAAIQPCHLDEMVSEAVRILQIVEHTVEGPSEGGYCTLTGTVARSFRGDIAVGTRVQTSFACANSMGLVGPTIYHGAKRVAAAGAVELHTAPEGGPAGHGWGLLTLEAPTEKSAFVFEYLGEDGGC